VQRLDEETENTLSRDALADMKKGCPLVCWSSASKYALFVYELRGDDCKVDVRCAGLPGAIRVEWVKQSEFMSCDWRNNEMHPFANEMLARIAKCSMFHQLTLGKCLQKRPSTSHSGKKISLRERLRKKKKASLHSSEDG
jgi:hypothetical protein